jgi:cold shock CspA family protein
MEGKIQKFVLLKGYGFIIQGFKTRLFFHVNEWKSDITPSIGMVVSYEIAAPNKPGQLDQAINIVPVASGVGGAQ